MDEKSSKSSENLVEQLQLKLKTFEDEIAKLQTEKLEMSADFEQKRSKIKDLYFAKESTIRELNAKLLEAGQQISALELTNENLKEEIENVKMIASVSENTKAEAVEGLNKQHQDEIESLRCVLQDSMEEQRGDLLVQFEQERRHWEQEKLALEKECNEVKRSLADSKKSTPPKHGDAPFENDQLGLTVEAARTEAETLKAVVVPLEAEIAELKRKLALAEMSLEMERQQLPRRNKSQDTEVESYDLNHPTNKPANDTSLADEHSEQEIDPVRIISLQNSTHGDLLNYVDALSKQKLELQKENDTLKVEMHEVCRSLEQEIRKTTELQKQSEIQFQNPQLSHSRNMETIGHSVGSEHWKEIEKVLANETALDVCQSEHIDDERIQVSDSQVDFQPFQRHSPSKSDLLSTALDNISVSSLPNQPASISQEPSSPQKVLSAPHLPTLHLEAGPGPRTAHAPSAWDAIPAEASQSAPLVGESRENVESLTNEQTKLNEDLTGAPCLLEEEKQQRAELETELFRLSEQTRKQVQELSDKLDRLEKTMEEDKKWRKRKETEDDKRLNCLQKDRDQIYMDYLKVKKENDNVRNFYERHRIDLTKQPVSSTNFEDLNKRIHRLRESLLAAQVERNHIESVLQSKLSFAQDSMKAEQVAKEQMESALTADLDSSRKQIQSLQHTLSRLEKEVSLKKELEVCNQKSQAAFESLRTKSKEIISDLKEKLKTETASKVELEHSLQEARNQVRSLQDSLETSEHVQKDFVQLSQSLQMQLEDIREREEQKALADQKSSGSSSESEKSFNPKPG